jgi:glutamate/tyrosine decarboxylase-like PLP-dependent enzyme
LGFDAARDGLGGNPKITVVSSTEIHQSATKALGTLGLGRDAVVTVPAVDGVIDLERFDEVLAGIDAPVIVVANAAEVNTGAFDPIRAMAERLARHDAGAWLHVDGAFGLYASLSPSHAALLDGIELADSVATDAHKWLNVPYDCGAVFYRDSQYVREAFGGSAAYLNTDGDETIRIWNALEHVPEMSRRFRGLAVWCALRAAGRNGYREIIERSIANAAQFAAWVDANPDLELLAPAHLNIVCFRASDHGMPEQEPALTGRLLAQVQRSGHAFISSTTWQGQPAIRAAFDNWSTTDGDVSILQSAVADSLAELMRSGATERRK